MKSWNEILRKTGLETVSANLILLSIIKILVIINNKLKIIKLIINNHFYKQFNKNK